MADSLPWKIFLKTECDTPTLEEFGELIEKEGKDLVWVRKDRKWGCENLVHKVVGSMSEMKWKRVFSRKNNRREMDDVEENLRGKLSEIELEKKNTANERYLSFNWYGKLQDIKIMGPLNLSGKKK